MSNIVI